MVRGQHFWLVFEHRLNVARQVGESHANASTIGPTDDDSRRNLENPSKVDGVEPNSPSEFVVLLVEGLAIFHPEDVLVARVVLTDRRAMVMVDESVGEIMNSALGIADPQAEINIVEK